MAVCGWMERGWRVSQAGGWKLGLMQSAQSIRVGLKVQSCFPQVRWFSKGLWSVYLLYLGPRPLRSLPPFSRPEDSFKLYWRKEAMLKRVYTLCFCLNNIRETEILTILTKKISICQELWRRAAQRNLGRECRMELFWISSFMFTYNQYDFSKCTHKILQ